MDAETSLDRPVVWRTRVPSASELELALRRLRAARELAERGPTDRPPVSAPPFVVVTPAGLRRIQALERDLAIRGIAVRERRTLEAWSHAASALLPGALDAPSIAGALVLEEVWRGLFPRDAAELWILADDRALERARAWREGLRASLRGVQVTLQALHASREIELRALHVPDSDAVEREWSVLTAVRRSAA
jgi:hypothetical protein